MSLQAGTSVPVDDPEPVVRDAAEAVEDCADDAGGEVGLAVELDAAARAELVQDVVVVLEGLQHERLSNAGRQA